MMYFENFHENFQKSFQTASQCDFYLQAWVKFFETVQASAACITGYTTGLKGQFL